VPESPHPVINLLPEQKVFNELGGTMRLGSNKVEVVEEALVRRLYGSNEFEERHRHRWEVNKEYFEILEEAGAHFTAVSMGEEAKRSAGAA
jgi:CTP synthase